MPPLVALVGRPNVGKSTLFNRLTRSRRAIVDPSPGVTRDRNYAAVEWDDRRFLVVDTGGFESETTDPISSRLREQTLLAVEEADVIVFLTDAQQGLVPDDREIYRRLSRSGKPVVVAANKIDGPEHEALANEFFALGMDRVFPLSSAHGYGLSGLMEHLLSLFPPERPEPERDEEALSIAVVGRPNVGKSSLINRILGEPRLVVSEVPGTTRDAVDSLVVREDKKYLFKDTAGIRRKSRVGLRLEKYSVIKALKAMEESRIALVVLDATQGWVDQDVRIAGYAYEQGKATIVLLNKWDLLEPSQRNLDRFRREMERRLKYQPYAPLLAVSARTGKGIDRIFRILPELFAQYAKKVSTSDVNRVLQAAVHHHSPPRVRNRPLKLFYGTQIGICPPTFLVFANHPEKIHFSYERFLKNRFRSAFGLDMVPVRILFRKRNP